MKKIKINRIIASFYLDKVEVRLYDLMNVLRKSRFYKQLYIVVDIQAEAKVGLL